jgi:hypothetical protein
MKWAEGLFKVMHKFKFKSEKLILKTTACLFEKDREKVFQVV